MRFASLFTAITAAVLMAGCPANLPGIPGKGSKGGSSVDPNTCGNYAASDAGARLKGFFEATVRLNDSVLETEAELRAGCDAMASELGISPNGGTAEVCNAVVEQIKSNLSLGLKAEAALVVDYKPAVCTVNIDAAATAAAECEGNASADVSVTCEGQCSGTCQGQCDGKCDGKAGTGGSGGQCNGQCNGTCQGSCTGGCEGHADVDASAECRAKAEVYANVDAECTEPEVNISFDAAVVVDLPKVEMTVAALKRGLPGMLVVSARIGGPVKGAMTTWAASAKELSKSAGKLYASLGDQAACVGGQIAAAVG